MSVTAVTVTYGKRAHLLIQALDAARAGGAAEAVVVDNGSADPIGEIVAERYGNWAYVHHLDSNRGSAVGFKTGIEQALERGAERVLLLDDDNIVGSGCVMKLQETFDAELARTDRSLLAVFAFRPDRHRWLVDRASGGTALRMRSTFRGFHILDISVKIMARSRPRHLAPQKIPPTILASWAPYSGLLFHRDLVEKIGLPNTDFVLYEDDTEFTNRLTKLGGRLLLVTGAEIADAERSWSQKEGPKSSFSVWLEGESDTRAFYAFRNGVFSDFYCRDGNRAVVAINMIIYVGVLAVVAISHRRFGRFRLLIRALIDGVAGRLGLSPKLPLFLNEQVAAAEQGAINV